MYCSSRKEFLEICRLVYDRYLTNSAGSNFSARASRNSLYVSISGNAKRTRLRMTPDDILHVTLEGEFLEGKGKLSRSWPTHQKMYMEFDFVGAVIHAHPKMTTALSCYSEPIPPLEDAMKKYGHIPILPRNIDVDSDEFGDEIVKIFRDKGKSFEKHGHAVLYPNHGVLVAAPSFDDAYDLLERLEFNSYAIVTNVLLSLANGYQKLNFEQSGASLE